MNRIFGVGFVILILFLSSCGQKKKITYEKYICLDWIERSQKATCSGVKKPLISEWNVPLISEWNVPYAMIWNVPL